MLLFFTSGFNIYGQNSCNSPTLIEHETDTTVYLNNSELWLKFVADTNTLNFNIDYLNDLEEIILYDGLCNNLNILDSSGVTGFNYSNLVQNNTYYIKLLYSNSPNTNIMFSLSKANEIIPEFTTDKTEICVGDYIYFTDVSAYLPPNNYNDTNIYILKWDYDGVIPSDSFPVNKNNVPISPFIKSFNTAGNYDFSLTIYAFATENTYPVSQWFAYYSDTISITVNDTTAFTNIKVLSDFTCDSLLLTDSSLNIEHSYNAGYPSGLQYTLTDLQTNQSYFFNSNPTDTITIPSSFLNPGSYSLKLQGVSLCGDIKTDSISFTIHDAPEIIAPDKVCPGDTVMFIGKHSCAQFFEWSLGDGTTQTGNDTIYHVYSQTGPKLIWFKTDNNGGVITHQLEVVNPVEPIIAGNRSNCDSIGVYTIENYDSNYTYTWSTKIYDEATNSYSTANFTINNSSNLITADTAVIDWSSATFPATPDYVEITVEAILENTNCFKISTFRVYQCCDADVPNQNLRWHDTIIDIKTTVNNDFILINGIVTLQDTLKVVGGGIFMGPYAKISLKDEGYLHLENTYVKKSFCDYMWDGIYTESPNNIVFINNSKISNAINGIVSENGGEIISDSSIFENNYYAIQILDHKKEITIPQPPYTTVNISITNNYFGQVLLNSLDYPYNGQQPYTGVNISNVEGVTIGDTINGGNTFENLRHGIRIYNSKVNIYNNTFKNIENLTAFSKIKDQGAININSPAINNIANIGDVKIGHTGNYINDFDSCEYDIVSNNAKLLIESNIFKNSQHSITVFNFRNGTKINNNVFKDVQMGIKVQNLTNYNRQIDVFYNFFGGQNSNSYSDVNRKAIDFINCNAEPNSSIKPHIFNNIIKYSGLRNFISHGIRIQNCNGIKVSSNEIYRNAPTSVINSDWDKTMGIRVSSCNAAEIADNTIQGFGQGIRTYGNLSATQFSCNEIRLYKYGFYWGYNTALSKQGYKGPFQQNRNTHNQWYTLGSIPGNEKLATATIANNLTHPGDIKWYYFSNFGANWEPNIVYNSISNLKINPTTNDNAVHYCASTSGSSSTNGVNFALIDEIRDPEVRDWLYVEMMQGREYEELMDEFRAYDAEFLYDMLLHDTTMMFLGGDNDEYYQEFFDSLYYSNVGEFAEVIDLINEGSYDEAKNLNNSITPEQDIYNNLKTVLGIYLDSWCRERYELTYDEYSTLYNIADQTPNEAGDAVYTARIMIGYEVDESEVPYLTEQEQNNNSEEVKFKLYPNPASDKITIEFLNNDLEMLNVKFNIYTITGSLVYSKEFDTEFLYKEFSVDNLNNGAYFYKIEFSNGNKESGKLIILKE